MSVNYQVIRETSRKTYRHINLPFGVGNLITGASSWITPLDTELSEVDLFKVESKMCFVGSLSSTGNKLFN